MNLNSKPPQPPENWEAALSRALKQLPERPAPAALLPSVMAQIRTRESGQLAPDRSWWQWPLWLRVVSAVGFAVVLALLFQYSDACWQESVKPWLQQWSVAGQTVLTSLAGATEAIFRTRTGSGLEVLRWVVLGLSLVLLAMYFACIGVGTFIYRTVRN